MGHALIAIPGGSEMLSIEKNLNLITTMGQDQLRIFRSLLSLLKNRYDVRMSDFDVENSIFSYGINSLQIIEIQAELERQLGIEIPIKAFYRSNTLVGMIDDIARSMQNETDFATAGALRFSFG